MVKQKVSQKIDLLNNRAISLLAKYEDEIMIDMGAHIDGRKEKFFQEFSAFRTDCLNFIDMLMGRESDYYVDFKYNTRGYGHQSIQFANFTLKNLKNDIANGWFGDLKDIVSGEIFSDFVEMADHLLDNSYEDAAAVILGGVIEQHLRFLCKKNNIPVQAVNKKGKPVPHKASQLNSELYKQGTIAKAVMQRITAMLATRNSAAHGHYSDYTKADVKLMRDGVRNFLMVS